jgi:hypothetical protein
MSRLDEVGVIKPEYTHVTKLVEPFPAEAVAGGLLKWYDIAPADQSISCETAGEARVALRDAAEAGALELEGELGFVILHRCGESFYFLLSATWRNENELWETVWARPGDDEVFAPWPLDTAHHPTFCVWELRAVCHEQAAWSRYLRSSRDEAAKSDYLEDAYRGPA